MNRLFAIFGPVVLALFGYATYNGWSWTSYDERRA